MKNGSMIVGRYRVDELDLNAFTAAAAMTEWEMAAYEAYGHDRCDDEGIWTLDDLFGRDFARRFRGRKNRLRLLDELRDVFAGLADGFRRQTALLKILELSDDELSRRDRVEEMLSC